MSDLLRGCSSDQAVITRVVSSDFKSISLQSLLVFFKNFGSMTAMTSAIIPATKNSPRQDITKSRLLSNKVVATELIRELVAINPQTRPCLDWVNHTRIILAIDGQPADLANTVRK